MRTKYVIFTLFALCLLACTPKDEEELIGGGGGGGPIISSPLGNVTTHGRSMLTLNKYRIKGLSKQK